LAALEKKLDKLHKKTDTRSGTPPGEPADNGSTGSREIEDQASPKFRSSLHVGALAEGC
jgi:hypothetical protein